MFPISLGWSELSCQSQTMIVGKIFSWAIYKSVRWSRLTQLSESEVAQSCLTLCDPMDTRLLHLWDFLGKSTGVGCHFLLQGFFPAQGSNPGLLHCRQTLCCLSQQGSPKERLKIPHAAIKTSHGQINKYFFKSLKKLQKKKSLFRPDLRPIQSESLRIRPGNWYFYKFTRWFQRTGKDENHSSKVLFRALPNINKDGVLNPGCILELSGGDLPGGTMDKNPSGTWVQSLVWEDPTRHVATKPTGF